MIAGQDQDQGLAHGELVFKVWHARFGAQEGDVELPPHQGIGEPGRIIARDGDIDVGQFTPQDGHGFRQPIHLLSGEEAHRE